MKQLLPRVQINVSYGGATTYWPVMGTFDVWTFIEQKWPMPWPVTFRNAVLSCFDTDRGGTLTMTLQKDGSDTSLVVALAGSSNGPELADGIDVAFAQFEDARWKIVDAAGAAVFPGHRLGWCVEMESQGNVYGVPCVLYGSAAVGEGGVAGALGNGFFQLYDASVTGLSTTYSVCSVQGSMTRTVMKTHATPPGVGASWVSYIRVQRPGDPLPVIQDGTGGTVDTKCEMTSGNTTAAADYDLPLDVGDIVEVLYYRTGSDHTYEVAGHIGIGLGFIPDAAGHFMLTGGSNIALSDPGYVWTQTGQNETDETLAYAPVGPGGFIARGLYVRAPAPGTDPDDEVTHTLRKNGADTDIAVVRRHLEQTGLIANRFVRFGGFDFINLSNIGTGGSSPVASSVYWGLDVAPEVEDEAVIGPLAWVHAYRVQP